MKNLENKLKISQFIWLALTGSMVFYGTMPILIPDLAKIKGDFLPKNILFGIACTLAVFSFLIRKVVLNEDRIASLLKKSKASKDSIENSTFASVLISYLISWTLNESIAIFGLVNYIITMDLNNSLSLVTIGIIMQILSFPKAHVIKETTKRIQAKIAKT